VRLASAICDFIQHARTAVSRETAIANSNAIFHVKLFAIFSQIHHRMAGL